MERGCLLLRPVLMGVLTWRIKVKRKWRKVSHYFIKGILYLTWGVIIYQAVVYFVNPVRAESYKSAIEFWQGIWQVFFS